MSCYLNLLFHILVLFTACYGRVSGEQGQVPETEPQCLNGYRAMAYYTNWSGYEGRKFYPSDLPLNNLTHVLYAFANINSESGEVFLSDEWADTQKGVDPAATPNDQLGGALGEFQKQKTKFRNLKILLSIGGWTYSSNFATPASSPLGRATFASSAVSLVKNLGLDGVDIDWEYPEDDEQASNFVLLLQEVREAFDRYSDSLKTTYHFEVTVACPAGPSYYQNLKLAEMDPFIDSWNIMAYDYSGPWSDVTAHQANLFSANDSTTPFATETAVRYYISRGIVPQKIVIGMPLYGRSFSGTLGLGQSFENAGGGTVENGVYNVFDLPLPGSIEVDELEVGGSYCWDSNKKELVTYDSLKVATQKAEWIRSMNLGGAMWWESSGDRSGENSTIRCCVEALSCLQRTQNMLDYPDSSYVNVRRISPASSSQGEIATPSSAGCVNTSTSSPRFIKTSSSGGQSISDTSQSIMSSTYVSSSWLPSTSSSLFQSEASAALPSEIRPGTCSCDPGTSGHSEPKQSLAPFLVSLTVSECLIGLDCPESWTLSQSELESTSPISPSPIVIFSTTTLPPSLIIVTMTTIITMA